MQIITTKTKVYKFDELSEEVKNKVIENLYDINIDYSWWDMTTSEDFPAQLNEIGLYGTKFYFDLDRNDYLYCDDLAVDNIEKLLKAVNVDLRTKEAKSIIENGFSVNKTYYASGAKNFIDLGYGVIDTAKSLDIENSIHALLEDTLENFKNQLKKEYEYLTSDESIIDTIEANDYQFTAEGKLF